MNENNLSEVGTPVDRLTQLQHFLDVQENLAQSDLLGVLSSAKIPHDIARVYTELATEPEVAEEAAKFSLAALGRGVKRELWDSIIGRTIVSTTTIVTTAEIIKKIIAKDPVGPSELFVTFFNNAIGWAGKTIEKPEVIPVLVGVGAAVLWTLLPPMVWGKVFDRESRKTIKAVGEEARKRETRAGELQELVEGRADLAGKVGPNVQIDVGKSDPAAALLIELFHHLGLEVVTYWDENNPLFSMSPYWKETRDDWTNRKTLTEGDVREAIGSIILVSNGDDVILSPEQQDTKLHAQDMTDNEALGIVNARDAIRREMGLPLLHHFLVTNPRGKINIGIARIGEAPYDAKTIGKIIEENHPNVHLVDVDLLAFKEIALIASQKNLPIELLTNKDRGEEYYEALRLVTQAHNDRVEAGLEEHKIKIATPEDGKCTLSIVYGSNDEDTIAQVEATASDFSQEGDFIAIINDPEKITRLPVGIRYICIGNIEAMGVFNEFSKLFAQGLIRLPQVQESS